MELRFSPRAAREIARVLEGLAETSPQAAANLSARLDATLDNIQDFPLSGRATSGANIRVVNTSPYPYLLFYDVTGSAVAVVAFLHGARDPNTMPFRPR